MVLELLDRGLTPRVVAGDLFREALATIGERWERGECTVATEHRACDIVTSLLPLVFPSGASLARIGRRVVVACPRGERDALGARVVGHVLEARGWEVVQLGGDAPAASIVAEVGRAPTHLVAISVAVASHVGSALDAVEALRAAGVDAPIAIGGEGVHAIPQGRLARLGHVHALGTLAALEERLPGWERPR
jgi:methanogenic corrinoid protein MtbC1